MSYVKGLISFLLLFFVFSPFICPKNIFAKEYKQHTAIDITKNIFLEVSQFSDSKLVEFAKHINEDAIPGETDYAEVLLTEAIRKNPKNTEALYEFAKLTERQALHPNIKIKKRFGFIYQAFLIDPHNPKIRYELANLFFELQQPKLFKDLYQSTLKKYPNHQETHIERIKVLSQSQPQRAIEVTERVLENGGNIQDFLPYFLFALKESEDESHFANNLKNFAEKYPNRWLWYHLGIEYITRKQFNDAETAFKKSIELGNDIVGGLQLAALQYRNQNKTKDAIINIKKVINKLNSKPMVSNNMIYFAHSQLACAYLFSNDVPQIHKELKFLAKYSYNNQQYFIATMNEFFLKEKEKLIVKALKTAIKKDPFFPYPYHALEKIYKKHKKFKDAEAIHKKITILQSQIN